jgi:hypothetical protein
LIAAKRGQQVAETGAELRFEPSFGLHAEEGIFVGTIAMAAQGETRAQFAAKVFGFGGQWSFVGSCPEGDLLLARERVGTSAVTYAGKLEAVQQQPDIRGGAWTNFNAGFRVWRQQCQNLVDPGPASFERGLGGKSMHEARFGCQCRGNQLTQVPRCAHRG